MDKPVTPRVAITYRQNTDQTWYVQAAKGYRIGGPNVTAGNTPQASYSPDSLWNYELGSKSRLMEGRLTSDFSIYDIEWNNIQVGLVTPAGFNYIGNGGKARIYGVEEQLAFKAMPWLEFGGTVSLDKARTTSAASISRVSVGTGEPDAALTNGVVPGYRLPVLRRFKDPFMEKLISTLLPCRHTCASAVNTSAMRTPTSMTMA